VQSSEQERQAKAKEARAEMERILAQQAAELERKKADMVQREAEREAAHAAQVSHLPHRFNFWGKDKSQMCPECTRSQAAR
jgi:hypothetical protein